MTAQYLISDGPASDFRVFSFASHEVCGGWKFRARRSVVEVSLIENLFVMDNSPDFGVHAAVTRRF